MFVLAIPTFSDILNDYSIFCKIYGSGLFFFNIFGKSLRTTIE